MSSDNALSRFLRKNTIQRATEMATFHSTSAYAAKKIILDGVINPQSCAIFEKKLTYLFYGRPSYKKTGKSQISKYWQLPSVLIFDYNATKYKRIYPFDTGAFDGGLYPDFFNMMPRDEYEVGSILDAPSRLISSFFVDSESRFREEPLRLQSDTGFSLRLAR